MAQKVAADALEAAIQKVLKKYGDDLTDNVKMLARDFAKQGAKAVSQDATGLFRDTGAGYASGWTSRYETTRYSAQGTIYNQNVPGLPHLLENPHAKRGGGRTAGNKHIAPVEEKLVKEYEQAVKKAI